MTAARFFSGNSERVSQFRQALWLLRESSQDGTPKEVSVLTLCSVFDGLVDPFRNRSPIGKSCGESNRGRKRRLREQRWITPIEKGLGMPFEWFEPAIDSWDKFRNPLAHGFNQAEMRSTTELIDAYSRLFGAVYMLMARQMGFSGTMNPSRFENRKAVDFSKMAGLGGDGFNKRTNRGALSKHRLSKFDS